MISFKGALDSTYYKGGHIWKEDFNESGFQMFRLVYLEMFRLIKV